MKSLHPPIRRTFQALAPALQHLAMDIHAHPELGFQEKRACRGQVNLLRSWGFKVQTPFATLPTAFKAVRGRGGPVLCFMAEYDALPEVGHGCGHNLIAPAALGAGRALADVLREEKRPGTVVVMGTPAEENLAGKVKMIRAGALKGLDVALMAHPSLRTTPDLGSTAAQLFTVRFHGKAAHAAGSPELGRNALDAVTLLFQGLNAWRQQLPESSRVHGIVTAGGAAANIIPDLSAATFYLRSPEDSVLRGMRERFFDCCKGAARMTGTRAEVIPEEPYRARWPNRLLNEAYIEFAGRLGLDPIVPVNPGRGSSDFGDVSQEIPGVHVYFQCTRHTIPGHSAQWVKAAGSAYARKQMLRASEALAHIGYRYYTDTEFRKAVTQDFLHKKAVS